MEHGAVERKRDYRPWRGRRTTTAVAGSPDGKYTLAYEAALLALTQQDATLANLRNRATGLFTVAAFITSFSSAIGLISEERSLSTGVVVGLVVAMAVIGVCAMVVLWPDDDWRFGPSPALLLKASGDEPSIRHRATLGMITASEKNERTLKRRANWYRAGVVVLLVETMLVVAGALAVRQGR
ncbi:hypothetical protein [Streptomyces sp. NPDC091371]|uniref:hypothetical protein n=1 Tax=Streptomyces sp. NPDC091371 TaxID=3155303 RepID=UPI003440B7D8